tara:strand:+ start:7606 stop:8220 length:615 start_codon:yes stop_codon:yes gene_type:complete
MTNEEILANEQDIDQKIQVKLDEFFNHASAVQVEEGTWYYQDVSVERELSDAYKTAFQMQRRIAELEQENALLLVKTLPECNYEGLQERITELEQCLVEVTKGATGQAPCAKYCEAKATAIEMRKLRAENAELNEQLENERMISMKRFVETGRADKFGIEQKIKELNSLVNTTKPCGKFGAMHVSDSEINRRLKTLRQQLNGGD